MIVHWKGDGILTIPILHEKERAIGAEPQIVLVPGYNEIPDKDWLSCKNHVENYLRNEKIEEVSKETKDPETGKVVFRGIEFKRIPPDKAIAIVKNCFSLKTLNKWLDGDVSENIEPETRDYVLKNIRDQIHKINTGGREEQPTQVPMRT